MRIALLALAGVVVAGNAFAASSPITNSFNVTATVAKSCTVTSVTDLAFGTYDPSSANFSTDATASGAINVRCTKGTLIHLELNEGGSASAPGCTTPARRMNDGGTNRLAYGIYMDSAHTTNWGCTSTAEQTKTAGASNVAETFTTYGVIPAGQNVPAGSYSDSVTYTVTF
jgi:spore coat protein U-like protein